MPRFKSTGQTRYASLPWEAVERPTLIPLMHPTSHSTASQLKCQDKGQGRKAAWALGIGSVSPRLLPVDPSSVGTPFSLYGSPTRVQKESWDGNWWTAGHLQGDGCTALQSKPQSSLPLLAAVSPTLTPRVLLPPCLVNSTQSGTHAALGILSTGQMGRDNRALCLSQNTWRTGTFSQSRPQDEQAGNSSNITSEATSFLLLLTSAHAV